MKNQERGFSLLEAVIALVLFTILLQGLLNFFATMYINENEFRQKAYLSDNAQSVNDFIREKIREADKVQIKIATSDNGTENTLLDDTYITFSPIKKYTETDAASNNDLKEGRLGSITILKGTHTGEIILELVSSTANNKGKYQLIYRSGGTDVLISDQIDNIKVKREKDSDIVEFACGFNKHGETKVQLKIEEIFTESLAYKA